MAGLYEKIDSLKHEIDRTDTALSALYCNLGSIACTYHRAIDCPESNAVYDEICSLFDLREEVDAQIAIVREQTDEKNRNRQTAVELRKHYDLMLSSLGAVAAEALVADKLPPELTDRMEEVVRYNTAMSGLEKKMEKGGLMNSFHQRAAERLSKTLHTVFHNTGKRLYEEGASVAVPGERARAIYRKLDELSEQLESAQRRAGEEVSGDESLLVDLVSRSKELTSQIDEKYTEYGRIISPSIDDWLDADAPAELRNACMKLRLEQRRRERQNLNMSYYDAEKEIGVHQAKLDQLDNQMKILIQQKSSIERQLAEYARKKEAEQDIIDSLRRNQDELSRQAADMEGENRGN